MQGPWLVKDVDVDDAGVEWWSSTVMGCGSGRREDLQFGDPLILDFDIAEWPSNGGLLYQRLFTFLTVIVYQPMKIRRTIFHKERQQGGVRDRTGTSPASGLLDLETMPHLGTRKQRPKSRDKHRQYMIDLTIFYYLH